MSENFNSASRIYSVLARARKEPGSIRSSDAWAVAFGVTEKDAFTKQFRVVELLDALRRELRLLQTAAAAKGISRSRYEPMVSSIHAAIHVDLMIQGWENAVKHLNDGVMNPLAFLIDLLPDEGTPLQRADVDDAIQELRELEAQVEEASLPDDVKLYLLDQIQTLLRALRSYPIAGDKALADALGQVLTSTARQQEAYRHTNESEEGKEAFQK